MNKPNFFRAITLLLACTFLPGVVNAAKQPGHPVKIYELKEIALDRQYEVMGSVQAKTRIDVINRVPGHIMELPWNEGDSVEKDALLVRIDDREITAEHDKAEANLKQARLDLNRLKKLQPRNLASEDEISRASTLMELARAEERVLRTQLNDTRLLSPVDAVVSEVVIRQGSYAPENSKILSLFAPDSIYIKAYLPESLVNDAPTANWAVHLPRLAATADQAGNVLRIHPVSDPATRQVTIEISVSDKTKLLPGMQANIVMQTMPSSRLWLPLMAIQEDERGRYVYINDAGKAARKAISTGEIRSDHIDVIDGLASGDQVVITGFNGLSEGRPLKIDN